MLPSVVSRQIADSVAEFLHAAFPLNSPLFNGEENENINMLEQFLRQPEALLKGPYLSAQLPFRKSLLPLDFFPHLSLPFPPHAHQAQAFERLGNDEPQPTLVATGTGSGKTECFMFPLLNYCAGTPGAGVKAIVIYPMNALQPIRPAALLKLSVAIHACTAKSPLACLWGIAKNTQAKKCPPIR